MIKQATQLLTFVFILGVSCVAFFAPSTALAQFGPQVIVGQGQVTNSFSFPLTGYPSNYIGTWTYTIGNGFSGTTTSAAVYATYGAQTSSQNYIAAVGIIQFDDNQYSSASTTCGSYFVNYPAGNPFPAVDGFAQLNPVTTCVLNPAKYYRVTVAFSNGVNTPAGNFPLTIRGATFSSKGYPIYYEGVATTSVPFYPMFTLLGGAWSLMPTTTASAVSISGAQEFCNEQFASSTGIGSTIGNGLCVATGFLFIPNSESLEDFRNIPNSLAESFPFSWIVQMRSILQAAQASSTDTFVNLSVNFGTTTQKIGVGTLDVISTSTISKYLTSGQRTAIKALLAALFYLMAAAFIYRSLQHIWQTS